MELAYQTEDGASMTQILTTERLILRQPAPHDWEPFYAFYQSDRAALARAHDGSLGPSWRTFASELGHWAIHGFGMWTVTMKGDDTAVGLIGPWYPADWPDTEIGWMVFDTAEGKGVAYEAAMATRDHAYNELGWTRIVSYIDHDNIRSQKLAERMGAVVDENATQPKPEQPCLVYLHPTPEAA